MIDIKNVTMKFDMGIEKGFHLNNCLLICLIQEKERKTKKKKVFL